MVCDACIPCADVTLRHYKRLVSQWTLQLILLLLVASGGAVSQQPPDLCTSPIAIGGRIFIENIPEDLPVGSTIGNLHLQGSPSEINISYANPHNPYVNFDPVSQNLTIIAPLDKESFDYIDINVECRMPQGFMIPVPIKITLVDVNDNPPEFLGDPYFASISELMPVGTTVLSGISAVDPDSDNWKITFEVLDDGPYASHFAFPIETSGNLVLMKPLDYEEVHSIQLHVVAKDNHQDVLGRPHVQLNSTTTATILLYDGDDLNPTFTSPSYLAYVTENEPVGTPIQVQPLLVAYDQDFGINATLSYSLVPDTIHEPPYSSYFSMDNVTGLLTLGDDVLRRGEQFAITVMAIQVDNPNRYSMTSLFILVQAANENQPRFLKNEYKVTLVENVPKSAYVTTVSAIDYDVGTVLTYDFANPLLINDFLINTKSGEINTAQDLSYERQSHYNISVSVTDGKWFDFTFLVVDLLNINNHNPEFDHRIYNFQGHKETNFYVGKVEATDLDADSVLTYSLAENSSYFTLNQKGEIYITGDVSAIGANDVHSLCITVEDDGIPARKDVTVARVTFGAGLGAVIADGQTDLVVIIILGVLSGCLLLIIIVLAIYIYRKRRSQNSIPPPNPQTYETDAEHIDAYFETNKSFERGINDLPSGYTNGYIDASEGVYKHQPRDRHLALYHDLNIERDSTTVQENPFQVDAQSAHSRTTPRSSASGDGKRSYSGYTAQRIQRSEPSSSNYSSVGQGMHAVNEIDYDTALSPMDSVSSSTVGKDLMYQTPSGSDPSFRGSGGSLGTFKVGNSTQALVPPHSPASSSVGYRGKGSSVSFIDDHQVNVYHPDNAINPTSGSLDRDKPEITVYY